MAFSLSCATLPATQTADTSVNKCFDILCTIVVACLNAVDPLDGLP